jgi:hypothetical protein
VAVEKVRDPNVSWAEIIAVVAFFFSPQLRSSFHSGSCRLTEEPHESFDVLSRRCQEELLAHELQSAQAQGMQSDLVLQFREQGFHLLSLPTDLRDCEWIADLLQHGLLRGSYVPKPEQRDLRDLTRYRVRLCEDKVRLANRIQKVLEDANVKSWLAWQRMCWACLDARCCTLS